MKAKATDALDIAIASKDPKEFRSATAILDDLCDGLRLASEEDLAKYAPYYDQIHEIHAMLTSAAATNDLAKIDTIKENYTEKKEFWDEVKIINNDLKHSMEKEKNIRFSPIVKGTLVY